MTAEEYAAAGIELTDTSASGVLMANAAIDYINNYTILSVSDTDSLAALPAAAKLFILKFCDLTASYNVGVTSESLGGMSQSFGDDDLDALLYKLLYGLLGKWAKSRMHFVQAKKRWNDGC